jgi:enoyl-CoA hydratase
MTEPNQIITERHGAVMVIRLANPPVNALTRRMTTELRSTFEAVAEDRSVNAIVLAAEGERAFCAGADLQERRREKEAGASGDGVRAVVDPQWAWRQAQHAVRHCPVPVVAAVDGPAVGGGFGLVAMCDLIVASERAWFQLNEINVGLLGGASKALRMLGPYRARSLLFTGEKVSAAELEAAGALHALTPPGEAEPRARAVAADIASKSPIAIRLAKASILAVEGSELEEAYELETRFTQLLSRFDDADEAMRAWVEHRSPTWKWS